MEGEPWWQTASRAIASTAVITAAANLLVDVAILQAVSHFIACVSEMKKRYSTEATEAVKNLN
jgi:hypothetical protein